MTRVVAWGELLWDRFPDGDRLGGAAANVAFHAARLGAEAVLVSRVGDDELGWRALDELRGAGVDVRHVGVDADAPTGTVDVALDQGEPRFAIGARAAWDRITLGPPLIEVLRGADALVFGTLAQRTPLGQGSLAQALVHVGAACVRLCDLNTRPPFDSPEVLDRSLGRASAVKLNESESERVARAYGASDPVGFLLDKRGARFVALTRGARGALIATRDARVELPAAPLCGAGDAVGAGDAFSAVCALGLAVGAEPEQIGRRAARYAAFVASRPGAMPTPDGELVASTRF